MITLAFDAASDRCTVAAAAGSRVAARMIDGARRHGGAIVELIDQALRELGGGPDDVSRVLTGDGPGSFTGLRVAASVAKALAWKRDIEWRTAPSLLVRAAAHVPEGGGVVIAVSDALRGELYGGCWRFTSDRVVAIGGAPRAMHPAALAEFGPADVVVGSVPPALVAAVEAATGRVPVTGEPALPDARQLIVLDLIPGGTSSVTDPAAWEPEYGRPAEAQAVWERKHGRELPSAPGIAG